MLRPQSARILIVEDDISTATTFQRALQEIGECKIAENSYEAAWKFADSPPHVIVLDIGLEGDAYHDPREAGIRVLEEIRKLGPPWRDTPVIIVTGHTAREFEIQCQGLGVAAFLKKPVSAERLREAVKNAIRLKVFISSAVYDELAAERLIVKQAIKELGPRYQPETIDDFRTRPGSLGENRQKAARECDLFILLLGKEYGAPSIPSPVEDEYHIARESGKLVLVFVKEDIPTRDPLLRVFLTRLRDPNTGLLARYFCTDNQLRDEVQRTVIETTNLQAVGAVPVSPSPRPLDRADLRNILVTYFSDSELHTMSFDLDIDYEDLPGETKGDKARELIAYCERHGRITELVNACQQRRPNVSW